MPNLSDLLNDTMLGVAAPPSSTWAGSWAQFKPDETLISTPRPRAIEDPAPGNKLDFPEGVPIWSFGKPALTRGGVQVTNVSCKVSGMNNMNMPILQSVSWEPVVISPTALGRSVSLPLEERFLIRSRYVPWGSIIENESRYWKLPADTDQSFEMVFGYELLPGFSNPVSALTSLDYESEYFMSGDNAAVTHIGPGGKPVSTLRVPPLQIIVVVSLVCCKARADFIPHGLVSTARIYPLVMVVANAPLDNVVGNVKLERPTKSAHTQVMDENMSSEIGAAFYTDRNDIGFSVSALWSRIFDYYYVDPPRGKYTMVTPSDQGRSRVIPNVVSVREMVGEDTSCSVGFDFDGDGDGKCVGNQRRYRRSVKKLAGQGEFDNLHLAPRMMFPPDLLHKYPRLYGLDGIAMAPFCIHDCLHTHWRWTDAFSDDFSKGWDGQTPYAKAGAPLVPGNQQITVEMISNAGFRYTAAARKPPQGQWQVMMHHGSAYVTDYPALKSFVAKDAQFFEADFQDGLPRDPGVLDSDVVTESSWAAMYWRLRYGQSENGQFERISWTAEQFAAVRELSPSKSAEYVRQNQESKKQAQKIVEHLVP